MLYNNTQDVLWRRKLEEQADLQQALELQSKRLIGLQLLDVKKHHHHMALSTGNPIAFPTHSSGIFHQNLIFPPLPSSSTKPLLGTNLHLFNFYTKLKRLRVSLIF